MPFQSDGAAAVTVGVTRRDRLGGVAAEWQNVGRSTGGRRANVAAIVGVDLWRAGRDPLKETVVEGGHTAMHVSEHVERAFSPIARAVQRFAANHSPRLDKCVRCNAGWELVGPHASGGDLSLLLMDDDRRGLGVGSVWQFPCPEMLTLCSHFRPLKPSALVSEVVVAVLESEVQALSEVRFGSWTHLQLLGRHRDALPSPKAVPGRLREGYCSGGQSRC